MMLTAVKGIDDHLQFWLAVRSSQQRLDRRKVEDLPHEVAVVLYRVNHLDGKLAGTGDGKGLRRKLGDVHLQVWADVILSDDLRQLVDLFCHPGWCWTCF